MRSPSIDVVNTEPPSPRPSGGLRSVGLELRTLIECNSMIQDVVLETDLCGHRSLSCMAVLSPICPFHFR